MCILISLSFSSQQEWLSESWWFIGRAQIQAFTFSWPRLSIKITVSYLSSTYPSFRREKLAHMCRTPWFGLQKMVGSCGHVQSCWRVPVSSSMRCLLCGVQKRHVTSMTVPENDICTRTRITLLGGFIAISVLFHAKKTFLIVFVQTKWLLI